MGYWNPHVTFLNVFELTITYVYCYFLILGFIYLQFLTQFLFKMDYESDSCKQYVSLY